MMIDNMRPAMTDAEQARHIAGLLELQAEEAAEAERHPLADAIAVMQRQGVR